MDFDGPCAWSLSFSRARGSKGKVYAVVSTDGEAEKGTGREEALSIAQQRLV